MHVEQGIHYRLETCKRWRLNEKMCLLDRRKFLKMQTSHEMNEKGMERSIPSKLSTTCWTSLQQQPGGLPHFTAVRVASNQPCGKTVDI